MAGLVKASLSYCNVSASDSKGLPYTGRKILKFTLHEVQMCIVYFYVGK